MPLFQVDLDQRLFDAHHAEISQALNDAQIEGLDVSPDDLFQVFTPHGPDEIKFDPGYNGVDRRQLVLIRVTLVHMYSVDRKKAFFAKLVEKLGGCGIRAEDILVCLVENGFEDWYAGRL